EGALRQAWTLDYSARGWNLVSVSPDDTGLSDRAKHPWSASARVGRATARQPSPAFVSEDWRRGGDSNPRARFRANGFQDRRLKPLGHPSALRDSQVYQ